MRKIITPLNFPISHSAKHNAFRKIPTNNSYCRCLLLMCGKVNRPTLIFIFSYKTVYIKECLILQMLLEVHTTDSQSDSVLATEAAIN